MFCSHCGIEIPNHIKFCPICGLQSEDTTGLECYAIAEQTKKETGRKVTPQQVAEAEGVTLPLQKPVEDAQTFDAEAGKAFETGVSAEEKQNRNAEGFLKSLAKPSHILMLLGDILQIAAIFLPFVVISLQSSMAGVTGSASTTATLVTGEGIYFLVVYVIQIIMLLLRVIPVAQLITLVEAGTVVYEVISITRLQREYTAGSALVNASYKVVPGAGFFLLIAGMLLCVVASCMLLKLKKK